MRKEAPPRVTRRGGLRQENDAPGYSDYEEDVTNAQTHTDRNLPGWKPQMFAQHGSDIANSASSVGAVPTTPSLIRSVDRIAAAHAQAYGTYSGPDTSTGGREADTESIRVRKQRWEVFWRDVTAKHRKAQMHDDILHLYDQCMTCNDL